MFITEPCPKSGRVYLKLSRAEVDAMGDIIFSYMKANPRDPEKNLPPGEVLTLLDFVGALLGDDDLTQAQLEWIIKRAQTYQIGVPPMLLTPGRTYEKFRGTWGWEEYHWLRRYKYARWLIACAKKNGVNLARELKDVPCTEIMGTPFIGSSTRAHIWVRWYELAAEPQIAEMAAVLEKNREAEKNKRSGSRAVNRAKELRAAGYQRHGFKWAREIDTDKKEGN